MLADPLLGHHKKPFVKLKSKDRWRQALQRVTVMDGLGTDELREVTVDELKSRFFSLGMQVGIALQMFVISVLIMLTAYDDESGSGGVIHELSSVYYSLFRALFLICFFFSCYGVNLFMWKRFDIDYLSILKVGHEHNYHFVIRASFTRMSVVFSCFVLYVLALRSPNAWFLPGKHSLPASAIVGTFLLSLWPTNLMPEWKDRAQRFALLGSLGRLLLSPLFAAPFASTFIADVLTSMPKIFTDMLLTGCMYASGLAFKVHYDVKAHALVGAEGTTCTNADPTFAWAAFALSIFPFWIRLMQCLRAYATDRETRHLFNSLKYCTSISVVVLSTLAGHNHALKPYWAVLACASTLFAYVWDLKMDWGHPALVAPEHPGEPARRYPAWSYNVAACTNAVARLGWAVYISPDQKVVQQHMILLLGCVELMRRAQWAAFRLEWEQHKMDKKAAEEEAAKGATAAHGP